MFRSLRSASIILLFLLVVLLLSGCVTQAYAYGKARVEATQGAVEREAKAARQDLAEMSGSTLFTVSRTLSQWEAAGMVVSGSGRVVIRQTHALVQMADDLPGDEEAQLSLGVE